jgi:hypothetical protein
MKRVMVAPSIIAKDGDKSGGLRPLLPEFKEDVPALSVFFREYQPDGLRINPWQI